MRSLTAVVVGYFSMMIAILLFFSLLYVLGLPLDKGWIAFTLIMFINFLTAIAGGFITAYIARREEVKHAYALAALATVMGILSILFPSDSHAQEPLFYSIANIALMIPGVILGGYIRARQVQPFT